MSTPLFIQQVVIGPLTVSSGIVGQSLTASPGTWSSLITAPAEQTLIESVRYSAREFSTLEGQLVLGVRLIASPGGVATIAAVDVPAGTSSLWASNEITLNLALPVGWELVCAHNVEKSDTSFATICITAHGGIVR